MDITCVGVTKMVFRPTVFQPEFKCLFVFCFSIFPRTYISRTASDYHYQASGLHSVKPQSSGDLFRSTR
jgi:hypothetical protein